MIVLSWNARGLNGSPKQKVVQDLIKFHSLNVVFIQDSKLSMDGMISVASKVLGRGQCHCIGSHGRFGGIACLWDPHKISPIWWIADI